jgi:hypothetical protein
MSLTKFNPRTAVLLLIIAAVAVLRVAGSFSREISPLINFTPVGAMALFGGAYFDGRLKPFVFPLLTLFIGDVILSFTVFNEFRSGLLYSGWFWTYAAFALMTLAGKLIIKDVNLSSVLTATLLCVFIHWIVADIGAWLMPGSLYPKTTAGYVASLAAAIPYETRFLAGTLLYSGIMFAGFEWLQQRYPRLGTI